MILMTDNVTKGQRSYIMSRVRGRDTAPELRMKKLLVALHFAYQPKNVYGRPDFANRKEKIAIFVDGCFWHGCAKHYVEPKSNTSYWLPKIKRNIARDKEVNQRLKSLGWRVIRIWEHNIAKI